MVGPQGVGGEAPGCPGTNWTQHMYTLMLTHCHISLDQNSNGEQGQRSIPAFPAESLGPVANICWEMDGEEVERKPPSWGAALASPCVKISWAWWQGEGRVPNSGGGHRCRLPCGVISTGQSARLQPGSGERRGRALAAGVGSFSVSSQSEPGLGQSQGVCSERTEWAPEAGGSG